MSSEKIVVTIDKSFNFNIQDYDCNYLYDYMKLSLNHDIFILFKTAKSLFDNMSTAKPLLYNKNVSLEDSYYKIESLDPSDTLYVVNKRTKNVDAYYSGLDLNDFYRIGVDYDVCRYIMDSSCFLDDILLETNSEGHKVIRPNLDCYSLPVSIKDDAGIYLYNSNSLIIYPGIHINLYKILLDILMSGIPPSYEYKKEKQSLDNISRILYEKLAKIYE
jgi:hypothetical protein